MTSGDIGPQQNVNTQTTLSLGSTILLIKTFDYGSWDLNPLDAGSAGDCFFKAVSHQLYGEPCHHLHVRQAGINYLRANPLRTLH